ncbi:MAG: dockerin type I domain-containing protein [Clostridium sp.]|nr:dockerin type I domain-containing protein [Clostridium sp.]
MKVKKILLSCLTAVIFVCSTVSALNVSAATDPNGDGKLDLYDVILITNYLAGTACPQNISQLDYDGNGIISQMDAYKIARTMA